MSRWKFKRPRNCGYNQLVHRNASTYRFHRPCLDQRSQLSFTTALQFWTLHQLKKPRQTAIVCCTYVTYTKTVVLQVQKLDFQVHSARVSVSNSVQSGLRWRIDHWDNALLFCSCETSVDLAFSDSLVNLLSLS